MHICNCNNSCASDHDATDEVGSYDIIIIVLWIGSNSWVEERQHFSGSSTTKWTIREVSNNNKL